jgi:hypothetical protein
MELQSELKKWRRKKQPKNKKIEFKLFINQRVG